MKALLLRPEQLGGVYDYLDTLQSHLTCQTEVLPVGKRKHESRLISPLRLLYDLLMFLYELVRTEPDVVHLNPTMNIKSIVREGLYLCLLRLSGPRVVVFFHGWDSEVGHQLYGCKGKLFRWVFNRADCFVVLASSFRRRLREVGFRQPVHLETTMIPEDQIDVEKIRRRTAHQPSFRERPTLLYLSRLVREKGLIDLAEAVRQCRFDYDIPVHLHIAGDGADREELLDEIHQLDDQLFTYHGFVRGEDKEKLFLSTSLFCLPTEHPEGLPISVLEAIAYGLPVLTTRVGGLSDHFLNEQNGYFIPPNQPSEIKKICKHLYDHPDHYHEISRFNVGHASNHYYSSKVSARIEDIYRNQST